MGALPDLTAADVSDAADLTPTPCDVPEWGGRIYLRPLTIEEDDERGVREVTLKEEQGEREYYRGYRIRLVQDHACDAKGNLLFAGEEGAAVLKRKAESVIDRIARAAQEVENQTKRRVEDLSGKSAGATGSD